jgi:hypothetical protein
MRGSPRKRSELGQSEIENLHVTIITNHYVFRLDVAMNDASLMCRRKGRGDLVLSAWAFFGVAVALVDGPQALLPGELPIFLEDVRIVRQAYEQRCRLV